MPAAVGRFPFVSKAEILHAYRPGAEPSDRTFRTLRQHGLVSPGLVIRRRRAGKVVGQLRCYAALNLDAVVLARHDEGDEAVEVASKAILFEERWQPLVAHLATEFDIEDFEALRSARNALAHALTPASEELEELRKPFRVFISHTLNEEFVRVAEVIGAWASLQLLTPDFVKSLNESFGPATRALTETIAKSVPQFDAQALAAINQAIAPLVRSAGSVAVDSSLLQPAGLSIGDVALLRIERSTGASLISLLAAVPKDDPPRGLGDEPFVLDQEFSPYFSDEPLPESATDEVARWRAEGKITSVAPRTIPLAS